MKSIFTVITISLALSGCSLLRSGSGEGESGTLSEEDLAAMQERRFGEGAIPTREGESPFGTVYFDYDSSSITDEARQVIERNAALLEENRSIRIALEGHTDERGTNDYNLALGLKRARAVADVLNALGIPSSRLSTISYGEEIPAEIGSNEAAWSRNRRVFFAVKEGGNR